MSVHRSEIVVGKLPVLACLKAQQRAVQTLYLCHGVNDVNHILQCGGGVPVQRIERTAMDRLSGGVTHQGVALRAAPLPLVTLDKWLEQHTQDAVALVVLDGIEDPQNFGAIVRSAAACGAGGVLFAKDRAAPITPAAMKAAAGAMEYVALIETTNLARALEQIKKEGFWVAALEADGAQRIWDADLTGRVAFIIGNEGHGIRRLVRKQADFGLAIPLTGMITSLNASVVAGVILAEWLRQQNACGTEK